MSGSCFITLIALLGACVPRTTRLAFGGLEQKVVSMQVMRYWFYLSRRTLAETFWCVDIPEAFAGSRFIAVPCRSNGRQQIAFIVQIACSLSK